MMLAVIAGWVRKCRLAILLGAVNCCVACAPLADLVERSGNKIADPPAPTSPTAQAVHDRLLVADLHADTLLWRKGLVYSNPNSQVDLARMAKGNVGLQVFTIATRVPAEGRCIHERNFDPAPLLALINGWPAATWSSANARGVYQAEVLRQVVKRSNEEVPSASPRAGPQQVHLTFIESLDDLSSWLRRYRSIAQEPHSIGLLLGAEGAHVFDDPDGPEFERLYQLGLRIVAPTHRFDNEYGGSSEGCVRGTLTEKGVRLINTAVRRRMIVDLAHASPLSYEAAIELLGRAGHPAVVSHSGLQGYLDRIGFKGSHRANSDSELVWLAQTGGVFGIGFWEAAVGAPSVDNVVGAILYAIEVLRRAQGAAPVKGGSHSVMKASEHVALGSDWDGAVEVAIDPARLAAITERLLVHLEPDDVANVMGLNACRVIAQSLGSRDYMSAKEICALAAPRKLASPKQSSEAAATRR